MDDLTRAGDRGAMATQVSDIFGVDVRPIAARALSYWSDDPRTSITGARW